MNSKKTFKQLAILFGIGTIVAAIYTVVSRGNAGTSIILMILTLFFITVYRRKSNKRN